MRLSSILTLLAGLFLLLGASGASAACTAAATATATVGPHSPNAVAASAAPYTGQAGGFGCAAGSPVLSLFGTNYLKATISLTTYKLTRSGGSETINFTLSATSDGTKPLSGTTAYYINGTAVDVLGLTGSVPASVPIYITANAASAPIAGLYTGTFRVKWEWSFCTSISVGVCLTAPDSGNKNTDVTINLTVAGVAPTLSAVTTTTTWDDQNGTSNPKTIPGARRRMTLTVGNPDVAVQDSNAVAVVFATPANTSIALDGDGSSGVLATFTEGSPASGLAFSYVSGISTGDDVEFSADGGSTWTFAPTAATEASVTHVRLKPRGSMAAKSNFKVSLAYKVK